MNASTSSRPHFNPSAWRAIVFDMDDTLYPERDFVFSAFRAVANWSSLHLNIPAPAGYIELKRLFYAGARGNTFNQWLRCFGIAPVNERITQLVSVYRGHKPQITPFPGAPPLLNALQPKYKLGLLSDGYLQVQQNKLTALGIAGYLDAIVFSDEWGRDAWKPSTKPFTAVLERLEIEAAQAVYIADNPKKDFLGANQIGMDTIWLKQPQGVYAGLTPPTSKHAPRVIVASWQELQRMFRVTAAGVPAKSI